MDRVPVSRLVVLASLSLPALLCACNSFQRPIYDVGARPLLLVPFRDLSVRFGHGYGESERGKRVVEAFKRWSERNSEPIFADSRSTETVGRELREWTREAITPKDWQRLLRGIDTELVLLGEIKELTTRDPKTIGFNTGRIVGRYSVIHAATGREVYRSTDVEHIFPPRKDDLDMVVPEMGASEESVEENLLRLLGQQAAKDLYGYYPERE